MVRCVQFFAAMLCAALCHGVLFPSASLADDTSRESWPTHLRVLTGPNGGQWFNLGDPIAEALTDDVLPTSSRMGGGIANLASVDKRMGDIGFSLSCFLGAGESGEEAYASLRVKNAILMANIYPQVLYFLVRKDFADAHGVTDVRSLLSLKEPVRFASLKPGTASEFILNILFAYGYDTSFASLQEQGWNIAFNNYAETADNFTNGDLDCFAYTAGTSVPLIQILEEHMEVLILPVEQNVLDLLASKFKTTTYTIKPGTYKSVTSPIKTLGDYTCLVTRKDFPDDLVFAMCKTLWTHKTAIADVIGDFNGLSPLTALPEGLPVHPGARKFWESLR